MDNSAYQCYRLVSQVSPVSSDEPHHSEVMVAYEAYGTCELYPRHARQTGTLSLQPAADSWTVYHTHSLLYASSPAPSRALLAWPALVNIPQKSHNWVIFHYTVVLTIVTVDVKIVYPVASFEFCRLHCEYVSCMPSSLLGSMRP